MRLVSDAKAAWRKNKEEERKKAADALADGQAKGLDGTVGQVGVMA